MAGNLPVPQGLEAKLVWGRGGVPHALNIVHFRHELGQTHSQARADQLDQVFKTALTSSAHVGNLHSTISLMRVESRHMDSNSDPWFVPAGAAVAGTAVGDMLPPANAFVVTTKSGLRGRSFNGRVYLTGFAEGVNDAAGQILAADADEAVLFLATANNNAFAQLQLVGSILSRWTTPPGSPPGTAAIERNPPLLTQITAHVRLDLRWDVQRRRAVPGV